MRVAETQTLFPTVAGSARLSNVYVDMCVPRGAFEVQKSVVWEPADPNSADNSWDDCDRYTAYIARVNENQGINPREALYFKAAMEGRFTFRYRVSTFETPVLLKTFTITVTP
jgi:hypothetical protein